MILQDIMHSSIARKIVCGRPLFTPSQGRSAALSQATSCPETTGPV